MRRRPAMLPEEKMYEDFRSLVKWGILSGILYWAFGPEFTTIIFLALIAHRLGPR
jgi:hypothetical protein